VQGGDLSAWLPTSAQADFDVADDGLSAVHREAGTFVRALPITALDISSSGIRDRLRSGRSIRYLVPDAARSAIEQSGCYRGRVRSAGVGRLKEEVD
jgi:nicotinic acid mononucleotide adenylyltransferase